MQQKNEGIFVIYSRKSKFTGKGESIENQIELCRQYISRVYGEKAAEAALVYEDEGFSGGNLERPQFKQMIQDSHRKSFAAIVVYRLDRISRNIGDFANLIQDLSDREIDFISIKEQFDTSSPMGRAMMYIASVFSQLERETIAERIRDNMHELSKTGRWLGGNTPTGYTSEGVTSVSVDGKTRKAFRLKEIPEEMALVRKIYQMFMECGSLTQIDQYLLEHGCKTKRGKDFSRFSIKAILSNPVYMIADEAAYDYFVSGEADLFSKREDFDGIHGIMAYNRTLQRQGKANQINPMNEWIVSVGRHHGVVPGETWLAVQKKLEMNRSKSYRTPRGNTALLSGLLVCGDCGHYMRPKAGNRITEDGRPAFSYVCTMKERSRRTVCGSKNVNGNLLDNKVVEVIRKLGKNGDEMAQQIMENKKRLQANQQGYDAEAAKVQGELNHMERAIASLVDTLPEVTNEGTRQSILKAINEKQAACEGYRRHLEELNAIISEHELADKEFDVIRDMLTNFGASIDSYNIEQKRAAIRACVKKIVWDGEKVHLYLFGAEGDVDFTGMAAGEQKSAETKGKMEPLSELSKRNPDDLSGG